LGFEEAGVVERRGPWQILAREQIYDNRWIRVTHHEVVTPTGQPGIYGTVHFKNIGIGILPIDRERHTYLVGQYRFSLGAYSWEIPEGGGALDVDPLESAARELQEETGLRAGGWHKLFDCDLSNSVTDERSIGYLAWDLEQGKSDPDPTEELRVRRLPLEEVFRMVDAGEIRDALSVMTLRAAQLLLLQGRFPAP
jgi:8-oxo-dGTP pyrophosphatase MutT (NUDIX family)